MTKIELQFKNFDQAIKRLADALAQEKNEFIRDSAIQRFEFTFDLAWKTVKNFLEDYHKIICTSPKTCLKEAYRQKLIDEELIWIELAERRNLTSHTYTEEMAEMVYMGLPDALRLFKDLANKFKSQINGNY